MTLTNEQRRDRYHRDEKYRLSILEKQKIKYNSDEEYRLKRIKQSEKYVEDNIDRVQDNRKTYYSKNKEYLKGKSNYNRNNKRCEVLYWYSNGLMQCEICGEDHFEFLCTDHIDNDGYIHRNTLGMSNNSVNNWIIKHNFPYGFQTICNNCNYIKEHERVQSKPKSVTIYAIAIRKQRSSIRNKVLDHYSNGSMKCKCCDEGDIRLLTIDHINGGGKQHTINENIKNMYEYLHYNNHPIGYRVLCFNCNKSLGQYGYCPHNNLKE